ncbi:MAG: hypothetical protein MSG64_07975 [Pyrinomonadaceae bacterium MAG19_C2-C3]|nr:hypothetical protein [Pyrinomonadaceae bacterium MAG19_C2-C3]
MKPEAKEKWARVRAKGFARYVFIEGILRMGGGFALLVFLYENIAAFVFNFSWARRIVESEMYFELRVINGVVFGLCMGLWIWFLNERAFKKHENKPRS